MDIWKTMLLIIGGFTAITAGAKLAAAASDRLDGGAELKQSLARQLESTKDSGERERIIQLLAIL